MEGLSELRKQIKKRRNISERSLDTYIRNVKIMSKAITGKDFKNLQFLTNFNEVKKYLNTNKESTRKNKLATILVVLRLNEDKNEALIKKYGDFLFDVAKNYDNKIKQNKKTLKQSENWVSIEELTKVFNRYKKQVYAEELHKASKTFITKEERDILQKYLVAGLYTLQAPRRNRDYSEMVVISFSDYDDISDEQKEKQNFLVLKNKSNMFFSFGDFKTKKSFGIQIIDINSKLKNVINLWRKFNPTATHLILNNRKQKMSANSLTKYLMKIFASTGKNNISSTMIRHIFITESQDLQKFRELKKKAEKVADEMGHSLKTQQDYNKEK